MIVSRDQAFRIVCNIRTPLSDGRETMGTGSFIVKENKVYLLTAAHVSNHTNRYTYLAMGDEKSDCIKIPIIELVDYLDWNEHPVADLALLELKLDKHRTEFKERCFPYDHINDKHECVSRDEEITVIGFPQGLGVQGKFSPLTFRSYASSSFLTLQRADRSINSDFFCLENPSVGGYSGGPVLDLGYMVLPNMKTTKEKTVLHGIIHGTISDDTGGKIAMITPMYYLKDII